jgi:hypothetical protein
MVSPSTMLTSAKEPTPASAMRTKDVMWTKWESREHAHTRTTGGDDADAICSALEISSGGETARPPVTIP